MWAQERIILVDIRARNSKFQNTHHVDLSEYLENIFGNLFFFVFLLLRAARDKTTGIWTRGVFHTNSNFFIYYNPFTSLFNLDSQHICWRLSCLQGSDCCSVQRRQPCRQGPRSGQGRPHRRLPREERRGKAPSPRDP